MCHCEPEWKSIQASRLKNSKPSAHKFWFLISRLNLTCCLLSVAQMVSPLNRRHHHPHHIITTGSAFAHYTKSSRRKRMNSLTLSPRRIKWTTSSARRRTTYSSSKRTRPDPQQSRTFCSGKFIRPFYSSLLLQLLLRRCWMFFVSNGVHVVLFRHVLCFSQLIVFI